MDAVLVGKLTSRDRIPQHWGQNWLESGEVTHDPAINESVKSRHEPFFEQRVDVLPVGRIPSNKKNFASRHRVCVSCRKIELSRGRAKARHIKPRFLPSCAAFSAFPAPCSGALLYGVRVPS